MPGLILVVEGDGDRQALPALVTRLLHDSGHTGWYVRERQTKVVGQIGALRKRLDDQIEYLRAEAPGGVLILLDLDDDCPATVAPEIAARVRDAGLPFPVAVVFAKCEFEAWLIASIETVSAGDPRFTPVLKFGDDPDGVRGAAEWIGRHTIPIYKKATDQKPFAARIDLETARNRSRSFRRLCHALDELVTGTPGQVTP